MVSGFEALLLLLLLFNFFGKHVNSCPPVNQEQNFLASFRMRKRHFYGKLILIWTQTCWQTPGQHQYQEIMGWTSAFNMSLGFLEVVSLVMKMCCRSKATLERFLWPKLCKECHETPERAEIEWIHKKTSLCCFLSGEVLWCFFFFFPRCTGLSSQCIIRIFFYAQLSPQLCPR